MCLNQHPGYGVVSPIVRIHRSSSQGVEMEMRVVTVQYNCFYMLKLTNNSVFLIKNSSKKKTFQQ